MRSAVLAFLLLSACSADPAGSAQKPACVPQVFDESRFTVCDPRNDELILFAAGPSEQPLRSFADIATHLNKARLDFAMNAGMFDTDGRPIGLAVVNGREVHKINLRKGGGNFHMLPNGVFVVRTDGTPAIFQSDKLPSFRVAPRLETQSGPMLLIDGQVHPSFEPDGISRNIRNGVGVTGDGKALFVISQDPVSFGKLARFFRDRLHTPNALYFDGSVSSLWDPVNGRQDSDVPLGPIIVALKPAGKKP